MKIRITKKQVIIYGAAAGFAGLFLAAAAFLLTASCLNNEESALCGLELLDVYGYAYWAGGVLAVGGFSAFVTAGVLKALEEHDKEVAGKDGREDG